MGKRSDPAAASKEVLLTEEMDRAIQLRREGNSIRAIAAIMSVSRSKAHRLVEAGLAAIPMENAKALQKLELERLDGLWRQLEASTEEATRVVSAAVKVLERRARLLGLDAPTKLNVTGKELKDMTDAEVTALREELLAKEKAKGST